MRGRRKDRAALLGWVGAHGGASGDGAQARQRQQRCHVQHRACRSVQEARGGPGGPAHHLVGLVVALGVDRQEGITLLHPGRHSRRWPSPTAFSSQPTCATSHASLHTQKPPSPAAQSSVPPPAAPRRHPAGGPTPSIHPAPCIHPPGPPTWKWKSSRIVSTPLSPRHFRWACTGGKGQQGGRAYEQRDSNRSSRSRMCPLSSRLCGGQPTAPRPSPLAPPAPLRPPTHQEHCLGARQVVLAGAQEAAQVVAVCGVGQGRAGEGRQSSSSR